MKTTSLFKRITVVLLTIAMLVASVPVSAAAEAEGDDEALAQQELLLEDEDLEADAEDEATDAEGDWIDVEEEDDFGPVEEGADEAADEAVALEEEENEQEVEAQARSLMVVIYRTGECKVGYDLSTSNSLYYCTNLGSNIDSSSGVYPWRTTEYNPDAPQNRITKITFTDKIKVLSASCMFEGMLNLASADLSKLDVSECTSFRWMFNGCPKLKTVNMTGWTINSFNIPADEMYRDCTSLQSVKVGSGFKWCEPLPTYSVNGHTDWYSTTDKKWYTSDQIYGTRDNIADTYTKGTVKRDISSSTCKASVGTRAWTGKRLKPTPSVKWGSTTLRKGTHFKIVSYGTNKNNGISGNWVKIQGIGSFRGTRIVRFRIKKPNVVYKTHQRSYGNSAWSSNGATSGRAGQAKRLEALYVKLSNKPVTGSVQYRVYVKGRGWTSWTRDGRIAGTTGQERHIEAVQIKLTGNMAKKYNVWYRVYTRDFGWMGWARNGARAGTTGFNCRLESIQIVLKPKGTPAPAYSFRGVSSDYPYAYEWY